MRRRLGWWGAVVFAGPIACTSNTQSIPAPTNGAPIATGAAPARNIPHEIDPEYGAQFDDADVGVPYVAADWDPKTYAEPVVYGTATPPDCTLSTDGTT